MCSWRYREGHTSSCRYVWPQRLFGKSRRNPHQHFITTQSVKNRRYKTYSCLVLVDNNILADREPLIQSHWPFLHDRRSRAFLHATINIYPLLRGRQCVYSSVRHWAQQTSNLTLTDIEHWAIHDCSDQASHRRYFLLNLFIRLAWNHFTLPAVIYHLF